MTSTIQPLALIDKCIGSRIWIIMKVRLFVVNVNLLSNFALFVRTE